MKWLQLTKITSKSGHKAGQWKNLRPSYVDSLARSPHSQRGRSVHTGALLAIVYVQLWIVYQTEEKGKLFKDETISGQQTTVTRYVSKIKIG